MIKIIGGSGFIGTRLSKRFTQNEKEFGIVDKVMSKSFSGICSIADVRDTDSLNKVLASDDIIINLAAEHRDDVTPKTLYDDVNVQGARNVCKVAEAKGISTIIFTSSVAVYGFAPLGTDESGEINYFNDYGRTKYEAELVYKAWQEKDPDNRKLVIVRPTVVFGEQNRGNVYNLLRQIASGKFMMIGDGTNRKSMAYVENITAFLEYSLGFENGVHIYNYIDKPDFDMNTLVANVNRALGKGFREELVDLASRIETPIGKQLQQELLDYSSLATFVKKFNETYSDSLLGEQKELLNKYILSFVDNGVDIKIFLNEEIGRLKNSLITATKDNTSKVVLEKRDKIINVLNSFSKKEINKDIMEKVLKVQQLTQEMINNGN